MDPPHNPLGYEEISLPPLFDRLSSVFSSIDLSKYTAEEFNRPHTPSPAAPTNPSALNDPAVSTAPTTSPPPQLESTPVAGHTWWPVTTPQNPLYIPLIATTIALFALAGRPGFRILTQGLVSEHMAEVCGPREWMRVVLCVCEEIGTAIRTAPEGDVEGGVMTSGGMIGDGSGSASVEGDGSDENVQRKWGMLVEGSGGKVVYCVDFMGRVCATEGFAGMKARDVVKGLLAGFEKCGRVEEWEARLGMGDTESGGGIGVVGIGGEESGVREGSRPEVAVEGGDAVEDEGGNGEVPDYEWDKRVKRRRRMRGT